MRRAADSANSMPEIETEDNNHNLETDIDGIEIVGIDETENYIPGEQSDFPSGSSLIQENASIIQQNYPISQENSSSSSTMQQNSSVTSTMPQNSSSSSTIQQNPSSSSTMQQNPSSSSTMQQNSSATSTIQQNSQQSIDGSEEKEKAKEEENKKENKPQKQEDDANNEMFQCNICFDVPTDPVITVCGHLYCWKCIHQWMNNTTTQNLCCPVCKAGIQKDKIIPMYGRGKNVPPSSSNPENPQEQNSVPPRPQGERPSPSTNPNYIPPNPFFFGGGNPFFGGGNPFLNSTNSFSTEIRFGTGFQQFALPFMGFNIRSESQPDANNRRVTFINHGGNFFSRLLILIGVITLLAIIFL